MGVLDGNGDAQWSAIIPPISSLAGLTIYTSAVVFDVSPTLLVRGVSNTVDFTIQ